MVLSHQDVFRSIMKHVDTAVAPIEVHVVAVEQPTGGVNRWIDGDLFSLDPFPGQRNADFVARGMMRFRGFWRQGVGHPTVVGELQPFTDDRFAVSQALQSALRGQNIAVLDLASGTGANQLAVASFAEVPFTTLDPVDGVGTVLCDTEFLLS
jgi:hypothetical protein